MRRYVVRLVLALVVVLGPFVAVVATGATPQLGLDLQGGISVVLAPTEEARTDALSKAVDIIRNRVDALGVVEPEVSRQGENILIDLPGVENPERARELVGQTAELRFRPVLQSLPPEGEAVPAPPTTTTVDDGATTTTTAAEPTSTTVQQGRVTGGQAATTTTAPTTETTGPTTETTAPPTTPTTVPALTGQVKTTPRSEDDPTKEVVLPVREEVAQFPGQRMRLGPSELTGEAVRTARAEFDGQWLVALEFTPEGAEGFDALAARHYQQQVAIVLDGVVQSSPVIQEREYGGEATITGNFSEREAKDLATVLRYGALPVQLEELSVQTVSPTLGKDQLRTGIAAGLFGLGLVALYMLLYYRLLGVVIWAGLLYAAAALYAVTSYLSEAVGLTLTLAGVTGIIVSVGITVDSYVVYFERLKDEVRSGKTIRSSLDRGFARSFRTILAADTVSLIGAALLYFLAVGSVRGFAFFLGLSTLLDIFVSWFFMHPLVAIIGRNPTFTRARWLGVASGLDAKGAAA